MKCAFFYCCLCSVVLVCGRELSKSTSEEIDYDLHLYFRSINKIADFFLAHKQYIDIIVDFGAFLVNLNIKRVLRDEGKHLPVAIKKELQKLVHKNFKLIEIFDGMFERDTNPKDQIFRNLTVMFNDDIWLDRIESFHDPLGEKREPFLSYDQKFIRNRYSSWDKYIDVITSNNGTPLGEESDACLFSLALNPINYSGDEKECETHEYCRQFMHHGTDLGYQLTHRLLFLLVANNGRGCYAIAPKEDRRLRNKFCADIFTESVFIEMNNYKQLDLLAEQILFCTLDGHSEFVKRHWLAEFLSLQTKEGCFPEERDNADALKMVAKFKKSGHRKRGWVINNVVRDETGRFLMLDGRCNGHTTVLVAGVLSSAVRFLLEKFY